MDDNEKLQAAIELAVRGHKGQFRKGSSLPYIVHPFQVLALIRRWGIIDPVLWRATICHDLMEDCPHISRYEMADVIGEPAALIVDEVSFFPNQGSNVKVSVQKNLWMEGFIGKSIQAITLKVADRIVNTRDYLEDDQAYAQKYWLKASCVMDAMMSRHEDIEVEYGSDVMAMMKYERDRMQGELVGVFQSPIV